MLIKAIDRYLELRRAFGYKLKRVERMLRSFAAFAKVRGDTYIMSNTAIVWAAQSSTVRERAKRLEVIIELAQFLHAEAKELGHEIPLRVYPTFPYSRPIPYILSEAEIMLLMQAAGRLRPIYSIRPHTFKTLFGLLAVSGLRISEALALRLGDLTHDGLVVRETKLFKSRLVPLHESAMAALTHYLKHRQLVASNDDHLFVSIRRTQLHYGTVRKLFKELCAEIGLPDKVRLHDLRHTVAVRILQACPHSREIVTPHMLALSTYLGHSSARSTFWYLHSTPQLMQDIAGASESWIKGGIQ